MLYFTGYNDSKDIVYLSNTEVRFSGSSIPLSDVCDMLKGGYCIGFLKPETSEVLPYHAVVGNFFKSMGCEVNPMMFGEQAVMLVSTTSAKCTKLIKKFAYSVWSPGIYAISLYNYQTVKRVLHLWSKAGL